jgi:thioredoxin reductase
MRKSIYDAVIIGAGHNSLVAANYLARANKKILILEQRHLVGSVALPNNSSMALSSSDVPTSFKFPYKK